MGRRHRRRKSCFRRYFCQNPFNNFRMSRLTTTALILFTFSATMVFIALAVSLASDVWRTVNDEQDAKDDYNGVANDFLSVEEGGEGGSRDVYWWVPGSVSIGGGGAVSEFAETQQRKEPARSEAGAAGATSQVTNRIGAPLTGNLGLGLFPSRPASIAKAPVPIRGNTKGVMRVDSVFATATLPINITAPNMLVNFTFNLRNFTSSIVRYASITRRMRVRAICTPPTAMASATVSSSSSSSSQPQMSSSFSSSAAETTAVVGSFVSYDKDDGSALSQRAEGTSGVSNTTNSSSTKGVGLADAMPLCTEGDMQRYCASTYGPFAAYVGSSFCRKGGCGDCYYYAFLKDYCLVVQTFNTGGASGGGQNNLPPPANYRVTADPVLQSCHYPFTDDTLQNYSWSLQPPTSLTVRVFKQSDPWIQLQMQTKGSCFFADEDTRLTVIYLACCALSGAVSLVALWLLYSYMQKRFAFGANLFHVSVASGSTVQMTFNQKGNGGNDDVNASTIYGDDDYLTSAATIAETESVGPTANAAAGSASGGYSLLSSRDDNTNAPTRQSRASAAAAVPHRPSGLSGSNATSFFSKKRNKSLYKTSFGTSMAESGGSANAAAAANITTTTTTATSTSITPTNSVVGGAATRPTAQHSSGGAGKSQYDFASFSDRGTNHHAHPIRNYNDMSTYGMVPAGSILPPSQRGGVYDLLHHHHHHGNNNNNANTTSHTSQSDDDDDDRHHHHRDREGGVSSPTIARGGGYGYGDLPASSTATSAATAATSSATARRGAAPNAAAGGNVGGGGRDASTAAFRTNGTNAVPGATRFSDVSAISAFSSMAGEADDGGFRR